MRTERARVADEHGLRREDRDGQPGRAQGAGPAGGPDRRRPLPGPGRLAPSRGRDRPARPGGLGVRRRRVAARRPPHRAHAGDRPAPRRGPGRGRRDDPRSDRGRRRPLGGRWPGDEDGGPRRRPAADPDPPAPCLRDRRLRAGLLADPREHGAVLLRLADGARPDADRRRVRLAAVVLAPVVVRRAARATRTRSPGCCRSCASSGSCGPGPGSATSRRTTRRSWARPAWTASWSRPGGGPGASRRCRPVARGWPSSSRRAGRSALIAPFSLDRFRRDHVLADQGSAGTR